MSVSVRRRVRCTPRSSIASPTLAGPRECELIDGEPFRHQCLPRLALARGRRTLIVAICGPEHHSGSTWEVIPGSGVQCLEISAPEPDILIRRLNIDLALAQIYDGTGL